MTPVKYHATGSLLPPNPISDLIDRARPISQTWLEGTVWGMKKAAMPLPEPSMTLQVISRPETLLFTPRLREIKSPVVLARPRLTEELRPSVDKRCRLRRSCSTIRRRKSTAWTDQIYHKLFGYIVICMKGEEETLFNRSEQMLSCINVSGFE
jgi:hypothetical protein